MGAAANIANVPELLKTVWQDEVHDFHYEDSPFYAMVPKDTSWDGLEQKVTIHYGGMAGRSTVFDDAKTNKGPPKFKQMTVPVRDNFAIWSVDHKLITLSRNQRGALVRALADSTERAHAKIKHSTCWMAWRNGGGAVGKVSSISTTVLTLVDANDVRNFDIDDVCVFANDDGIAAGGLLTGERTVTALDPDAGTVTFDTTLATIAGLGAGDFVFHIGDYNNCFSGVPAYIPLSTPGSGGVPDAIHSMTRSAHPSLLAGSRFTASTANVADEVKLALAKAFRRNIRVTHLFCGPEAFDEIDSEVGTSRRYVDDQVGRVGFKGLEFNMQGGKVVKLFSDPDIPKSTTNARRLVYGLNLESWKFWTAESYPMWLNLKNNKDFMLEENSNSSEGRIGGYGQIVCDEPFNNFVLELTA